MRKKLFIFLSVIYGFSSYAQTLAFPGAEGYGKYTMGGRGGKVFIVTNLNDSGPGSLREAVESSGPRTVLFAVDGTIELKSPLRIENDYITIAGQSAPGDGICLKDFPLNVNASNTIVRYIRVRVGDKNNFDFDGLGGGKYGQKNVILDHLSVSWSIDECLSIYKTENLTVQWCLVAHSLCHSVHTKGNHGFGGIWGGYKATFHHNLLANHSSRNPRFSSVQGTKMVDHRNNVIFNWGFKSAYGGGQFGEINMVGNYYKPGPASEKRNNILDVAEDGTGRYFVNGNFVEGDKAVTKDNWKGVGGKNTEKARVNVPFAYEPINEDSPKKAYKRVLNDVGCNFIRDSYDQSIIEQVRLGIGRDGKNGIIDSPSDVGGWPELKSGKARADIDKDGMPDAWENKMGLNPNDPDDNKSYDLDKQYTNLEIYLNSLVNQKS
jgi:pectate lyase